MSSIPSRCVISTVKLNELLVSWLGSDDVYENVLKLIEKYDDEGKMTTDQSTENNPDKFIPPNYPNKSEVALATGKKYIPPFYPLKTSNGVTVQRRRKLPRQFETWDPLPINYSSEKGLINSLTRIPDENTPGMVGYAAGSTGEKSSSLDTTSTVCVRDQILKLLQEVQILPQDSMGDDTPIITDNNVTLPLEVFVRITKEICHFPSFFNGPLYQRIIYLWNNENSKEKALTAVTLPALEWYWKKEMEPFDPPERFFRLVKQPDDDCILRDDFLPYIKALLNDHPVSAQKIKNFSAFLIHYVKNSDSFKERKYIVMMLFEFSLPLDFLTLNSYSSRAWNFWQIMPNSRRSMRSQLSPVYFTQLISAIRDESLLDRFDDLIY
mmetsp:Transcript_26676/g.27122  ORF Transcript_26676/g.27122 Transcript_26676/m.27122 type:complete len:381 (+) Transcript_26676:19-1161(+)